MDDTRRDAVARHLDHLRAAISTAPDRLIQGQAWIALAELQQEYDAALVDERHRGFGYGWDEGHRAGEDAGWKERDEQARAELIAVRSELIGVAAERDAARAELADPIGQYQREVEGALQRRRQKRATRSTGVH